MSLFRPFKRRNKALVQAADLLYQAAVAQARQPAFYLELGVPDTLDGRFDMICLHVFLLLKRLKDDDGKPVALSQALFDRMFADMDDSLREVGASDITVGAKVKRMARAFNGRMTAYDGALAGTIEGEGDESPLETALRRNVYRHVGDVDQGWVTKIAAYTQAAGQALAAQPSESIEKGQAQFPELAEFTS